MNASGGVAATVAEAARDAPGARIPAEMLYWGRLPAATRGLRGDALRFRFERLLPVPVERLHTVSAAAPGEGALMVGIEPERLRAHFAAHPELGPDTWTLTPDRLPEHLREGAAPRDDAAVLAALNLLHGAFEPAPRRRLRLTAAALLHGGLVLALIIALVGIERRVAALGAQAAAARQLAQQELDVAVPPQPGARTRPELRLAMELRILEQAARSPSTTGDVSLALQQLWNQWPKDLRLQIETVTATPERVVVRGVAPTLAEAERLARSCATLEAGEIRYRAEPLQAQSGEHGAAFLLTLVRQASSGSQP